jgi:serine/threonine protein kinase/Flp pilus assembly protein TadD
MSDSPVVRGSPHSAHSDRNLLVGMLAFQNGFVRREQLLSAMNAWLIEKETPLEDILVRQGAIDAEKQQLLVALVRQHLAMHENIAEKSLADVSSLGSIRDDLRSLADPDLNASLVHVAADPAPRASGSAAFSCATGSASAVFRRSPDPAPDRFATVPPTIGASTSQGTRFRILRPHARGGLGEVHVALDTELNREVAIKEIQPRHADHPESRARFTLEAEITGGLEHPGIVPVYGLGTYADGRPYYAMRFIRGDSLAEKIERFHKQHTDNRDEGARTLELHKLLRRFIDVCEAIQYAHDRGVLHRDLKPGNIMLGKYGETLVVDWGLAKALTRGDRSRDLSNTTATASDEPPLAPPSGSASAPTEMGAVVGTPAYMSPEQAAGRLDQLGPPSDVYSLGATLYTLLTGRAPFQVSEGGVGELLKRVSAGDFVPPRQVSPAVPKPLEAVCLKAMATKPAERYATPARLRDDLEHWLADEPVSAATETLIERSARFVRKHRSWALATAAALLLVAAVSTIAALLINEQKNQNAELAADNLQLARSEKSAREVADAKRSEAESARKDAQANARRADDQSALALKTLNTVVYSIQSELAEIPAARPVRQRLLSYALDGLDAVAGAADTVREASRSQFVTHSELGNLFSLLGSPQAVEQRQKAHAIAVRLARSNPENAEAQRDLWVSYNRIGEMSMALGNVAEAKEHFEKGLAISRPVAEAKSADAQAQRDLLVSWNFVGNASVALGNFDEAQQHFERYREISRRLAEADPTSADAARNVSIAHNKLGEVSLALGNAAEAKKHFEQHLDIARRLAADDPDKARAQHDLSVAYSRLGDLSLALGQLQEAKKHFQQDLDITRRMAEADPANAQAQRELSISLSRLGEVSLKSDNVPDAKKHFEQGLAISRRLVEADPANATTQVDLTRAFRDLAKCEMATMNYTAAKTNLVEGIAILTTLEQKNQLGGEREKTLLQEQRKLLEECEQRLSETEK